MTSVSLHVELETKVSPHGSSYLLVMLPPKTPWLISSWILHHQLAWGEVCLFHIWYFPGTRSPQGLMDHVFCLTWRTADGGDNVHLKWWWLPPPAPPYRLSGSAYGLLCDSEFTLWNLGSFQPGLNRHSPVFYHLPVPGPTTQNSLSARSLQRLLLVSWGQEIYPCLPGWRHCPLCYRARLAGRLLSSHVASPFLQDQ